MVREVTIVQISQKMKKLTKIKLVNWHYFQNETIDVDGSFLLSGENASGKSTILDAIQLVLTTSTKSFNLATTVGEKRSKRDLKGYVRCKTGEEGNAYYRNGSVISFVALEFYEDNKDRFFTIGVKIDSPDVESDLKKKWFCIESSMDSITFIVNNKPALDEQFTSNGKRVSYMLTASEAKEKFRTRLGYLPENFFEMIPKSLAFKPMDNVKSFINKFILPEKRIDVDTLRENIRNLREMQVILSEVRRQVEQLEDILRKYEDINETDKDILVIDLLLKIANLEDKKIKLENAIQNKILKENELERKTHEISEAEVDIESDRAKYNEIQVSIKTSDCAALISKLNNEIDKLEDKKRSLDSQVEIVKQQIVKAEKAIKVFEIGKSPVSIVELRAINDTIISDDEKAQRAHSLGKAIEEMLTVSQSAQIKANVESQDLLAKREELKKEIDLLKKNEFTYPTNTVKLQAAIRKEFANRGIRSEVRVLADLLEITDERWQDAVEGYLNTQRFYLIVNPEVYDIATEVYDRHKHEIHTVALVNTGVLKLDMETDSSSLAAVVTSENRYALAYVREILNRVTRCNSVKELKQHNTSITAGCMLYKGKAVRKINPDTYRVPYIGKFALKKQIDIKTAELEKLDERSKELKQLISELLTKIAVLKEFNLELLVQNIGAPAEVTRIKNKLREIGSELREAENDPNIIELHRKAQELEGVIEKKNQSLKELYAEKAGLKSFCENLEENISTWSRENTEAANQIEIMAEGSRQALEDARKKYSEHIKTKSASTIYDNNGPRRTALENQRKKKYGELTALQTRYKDSELGTGDSEAIMKEYSKEYFELSKHNLIQCEEKLEKARQDCEIEFRENFLSKMRENIENADNIFKSLNKSLKDIKYGRDSYHFILKSNSLKQGLYEMITSDINMGGNTLFSSLFETQYHSEMEDLFSKLTESDTQGDTILKEYTDYRGYLDYDIEVISNGKSQLFSKIYGEKSGGETQTPYYVAIAASFAQMYSLGDSIRIIMLDEAFDKMDDERIGSMMQFFRDQNFQVILATPPAKMEIIGEYVDDIFVVFRDGYNSFVESYSL